MGGVIALANARIELQTGFAAAYMIINIFYWIGAALPPADHWNLKRLKVDEIIIEGGRALPGIAPSDGTPSYTEALWKAIAITGSRTWIKEAGWAPKTQAWDDWLLEAETAAKEEKIIKGSTWVGNQRRETWKIRSWDYKGALSTLLRPSSDRTV